MVLTLILHRLHGGAGRPLFLRDLQASLGIDEQLVILRLFRNHFLPRQAKKLSVRRRRSRLNRKREP